MSESGVGTVEEAIARLSAGQPWLEQMVIADDDLDRARGVADSAVQRVVTGEFPDRHRADLVRLDRRLRPARPCGCLRCEPERLERRVQAPGGDGSAHHEHLAWVPDRARDARDLTRRGASTRPGR